MRLPFESFIVFLCAVLLTDCTAPNSHTLHGLIDAKFVKKLEHFPFGANILISSTGGDPDFAEDAARITQEKQFSFTVQTYCISSCVEYLLSAAAFVEFKNAPIIGVHQNPSLINAIKNMDSDLIERRLCYFEDNLAFYESLRLNGAVTFTKAQLELSNSAVLTRLNLVKAQRVETDYCIETGFKFENQLWLPTSNQLAYHWNLTSTGKLCADNYETCKPRIDNLAPYGNRVVVGDDVYTSQNSRR